MLPFFLYVFTFLRNQKNVALWLRNDVELLYYTRLQMPNNNTELSLDYGSILRNSVINNTGWMVVPNRIGDNRPTGPSY